MNIKEFKQTQEITNTGLLDSLELNYEKFQAEISKQDANFLASHNQRYPTEHPYHLHSEIKPCPFEGDLLKAKVILLLANPHFQTDESSEKDHERIDGWGVWGLSTQTNQSMYGWWRPRLKHFIQNVNDENEWKALSWQVASFQAVAWASENFHECNQLPSKKLMAETLKFIAKKRSDVVFVVMRNKAYWTKVLDGLDVKTIYVKNPRCSFLTPNNMRSASDWEILKSCLNKR